MTYQTFLNNRTPFSAEKHVFPDSEGQEIVLIIVVATFEADRSGQLNLAEEQLPVFTADEFNGATGLSSVSYESDVALIKPMVDVLVNGNAYAPNGRPSHRTQTGIMVADVQKSLVVTGDRFWLPGSLGVAASSPKPFLNVPIVYERAFGGIDTRSSNPAKHDGEPRNPVGVGFQGVRSFNPEIQTEIPNVEYHHALMTSHSDKPEPAGFGVVGRGWAPRIDFAGTYDDKWLNEQWPFLPMDFDPRHYQAAPADQQSQTIRGGEAVRLVNLTPDGLWDFHLPILNIPVRTFYDNRQDKISLRMDTVLIEPDLRRVRMTSRACIKTVRNRSQLREIVLGHMTSGWLRARTKGKLYIDINGRDGAPTRELNYKL